MPQHILFNHGECVIFQFSSSLSRDWCSRGTYKLLLLWHHDASRASESDLKCTNRLPNLAIFLLLMETHNQKRKRSKIYYAFSQPISQLNDLEYQFRNWYRKDTFSTSLTTYLCAISWSINVICRSPQSLFIFPPQLIWQILGIY